MLAAGAFLATPLSSAHAQRLRALGRCKAQRGDPAPSRGMRLNFRHIRKIWSASSSARIFPRRRWQRDQARSRLAGNPSAPMPLPQHFRTAAVDAAEAIHRNRLAIDQIADLCTGSRRGLDESYALLHKVQESLGARRLHRPPTVGLARSGSAGPGRATAT